MADVTAAQQLETEALRNTLGNDLLELSRSMGKLPEVITLATNGYLFGADASTTQTIIRQYLCFGTEKEFKRAERRLLQQGQNLPPELVELNDSVEELLKLAGGTALMGDTDFEVLRDTEMLGQIKKRGVVGAKQAILGTFVSRWSGMPLDIAQKQPTSKSMKALEFLWSSGCENAAKKPEFWKDWDRGMSKEELLQKWTKRRDEEDARESARQDREFRERMEKVQKVWLHWEMDRFRAERQLKERMREEAERKAREARRRKPPVPRKKPPPNVRPEWTETPVRVLGSHERVMYILRAYDDNSSELFRVQDGQRTVVLERAMWRFAVYKSGPAPLIRPLLAPKPCTHCATRTPGPIGKTPGAT